MIAKRIACQEDVEKFKISKTYNDIVSFILSLNDAAKDREIGVVDPVSPAVATLTAALDNVNQLISKHPAAPSSSRFGKPEYAGFYDESSEQAPKWLEPLTSNPEVAEYFAESFGNRQRIDYGSGHELNFICSLLCLYKSHIIDENDLPNLVLNVFNHYLDIMRLVQQTYWLEPAGSHGVWGLDDYHFLPYLFGSGQLLNDHFVRPINIHDPDIVDIYKTNYYFKSVAFINKVKTASLRWTSPLSDDICTVKKWSKVNEGLIKMYKVDVLGTLNVIQHFLFSDLLPAPEGVTEASKVGDEVHLYCWADCCGIRVPSAIAASESKSNGHNMKKSAAVPVD